MNERVSAAMHEADVVRAYQEQQGWGPTDLTVLADEVYRLTSALALAEEQSETWKTRAEIANQSYHQMRSERDSLKNVEHKGTPCTCGYSGRPCGVDEGSTLGDGWYCTKRASVSASGQQ